jgi:hypothetical protein
MKQIVINPIFFMIAGLSHVVVEKQTAESTADPPESAIENGEKRGQATVPVFPVFTSV